MIPKKIHYCWFGGNQKSELIQKCIESWKKYAPDYDIIEWNENNYDIDKIKYSKQAYEAKKYAFVSDVARFEILFNEGGIYLDTDVELIKPIDAFLENHLFMGYDQKGLIASGLIMGAEKNNPILMDIIKYYKVNCFLLENGRPNSTTVVTIVSDILKRQKIELDGKYREKDGITLYPWEVFDPYDYEHDKMKISEHTVSIHHYAASWKNSKDNFVYLIGRCIKRVVGDKLYDKIARFKHRILG